MKNYLFTAGLMAAVWLGGCTGKPAGEDPAVQALLDRVAIEDLLTSYYSHFGGTQSEDFAAYYTRDATFDVNGRVAKGRDAIVGIYKGMADSANQDENLAARGVFHMLLTNVEIAVDGERATARLYWTGILNTDPFGPPHLQEHGREYDRLVKQDGKWLIAKRVVIADSAMPESFRATYQPRRDYDITKDD